MPKSKFAPKTVRKEVKKEIKAIKKAARKAPMASSKLRREAKAARPRTIHGKGGYFGDLGGKVGNIVDTGVGLAKAITGLGSYRVHNNTLLEGGAPPKVKNSKDSRTYVSNPEYICDITSSVNFSVQKFPVNPGIPRTFPWLAPQAVGYEQYKPKGVLFEFRSTCGDAIASTNNAMGSVIMCSEYNVNLPDFTNKQQMEDHEYRTPCKPNENALHPIECARSKTVLDDLYIRNGTETVPDLKFYDLCNFYIATQGQQTDGVTIGELWVTYEFEFLKPALSGRSTNTVAQHWYWDSNIGVAPTSSLPIQNLKEKNTGQTTNSGSTSITTLQPGNYMIQQQLVISGSGISVTGGVGFSPSGNVTNLYGYLTNPVTAVGGSYAWSGATSSVYNEGTMVTVTAPVSIVALKAISSGTMSSVDLWIFPFGSQLTLESRRPVDYDPLVVMQRKLDKLYERMCLDEARHRQLYTPPWARDVEDERYIDSSLPPPPSSPASSGVCIEDSPADPPELSRSTVNLLLDRLNIRNSTSKTGSRVSLP